MLILGVLCIGILILFSALISGSEVSFFSLSSQNLEELSSIDEKKEKRIRMLLSNPNKLLATILIANNFINVAIIVISYFISSKIFVNIYSETIQFIIQVVIITFILVLLGEITPKVYAKQHAVKFSKNMVSLIQILQILFSPLSRILLSTTSFVENRVQKRCSDISMKEISKAIELTTEGDDEDEKRILKSILEFGNIDVKEIMSLGLMLLELRNHLKTLPDLRT